MPSFQRRARFLARVLGCATAAVLVIPSAPALAAQSWQSPQTVPTDRLIEGLALDGSGADLALTYEPSNEHKELAGEGFAIRPHGGVLGVPQPLAPLGTFGAATFTTNAAGDAFAYDGGHPIISHREPGSTTFTLERTESPNNGPHFIATDVAVAPDGTALAIGSITNTEGPNTAGVIFRPAEPGSTWDIANRVVLPPATGDTTAAPIGITLDADGGAVAVYQSYPSQAILQTFRPANQANFEQPTQLPATRPSGISFHHGLDGTAIVGWGSGPTTGGTKSLVAAVRAPGHPFGAPQTVLSSPPGEAEIGGGFAAGEGGHAMADATNQLYNYNGCGSQQGFTGSDYGWKLASFTPDTTGATGTWTETGAGPSAFPNDSGAVSLSMTGNQYIFVSSEEFYPPGTRCGLSSEHPSSLNVYKGTFGGLGGSTVLAQSQTTPNGQARPSFVAAGVNSAGDGVFVYTSRPDNVQHLVAYEDPSGSGGGSGGGGSGGGGGGMPGAGGGGGMPGAGGGTAPPASTPPSGTPGAPGPILLPKAPRITAPGSVKVTGPIIVTGAGFVPIQTSCDAAEEDCAFVFRMFGIKHATITAKAPKPIASVHGTIKAGAHKTIRIPLDKATRKLLLKHHRIEVRLVGTITAGANKTSINKTLVLKTRGH